MGRMTFLVTCQCASSLLGKTILCLKDPNCSLADRGKTSQFVKLVACISPITWGPRFFLVSICLCLSLPASAPHTGPGGELALRGSRNIWLSSCGYWKALFVTWYRSHDSQSQNSWIQIQLLSLINYTSLGRILMFP